MAVKNINKYPVSSITTYVDREKANQPMVEIRTTNGKVYKRQYYVRSGMNCFIYNNGWYSFRIDGNKKAFDVKYERAYKTDEDTTFRMQVLNNERTDTGGQDGTENQNPTENIPEEIEALITDFDKAMAEAGDELPEPEPEEEIDWDAPVKHMKYGQIQMCIENNIPVYLSGPAGSGKNHVLEQIAAELNMSFYFSNSIQQEYKLTGFIDAGGKYHETEFFKAANDENECVFFLDEMDASIPEVLVLLNAAIANGYFEFPTGRMDINHIHFVAAGNTVGSGSDDRYTGRMVIDQATLDRFAIIEFDYDMNIELHITRGNKDLVGFIRGCRDEADRGSIRTTFSYRCMAMVTKLEKAGMGMVEILAIAVMKGLDKDTVRTIKPVGFTKYHEALRELQRAA